MEEMSADKVVESLNNGKLHETIQQMRRDPAIMHDALILFKKDKEAVRRAKQTAQEVQRMQTMTVSSETNLNVRRKMQKQQVQAMDMMKKAKNYRKGDVACACINQNNKMDNSIVNTRDLDDTKCINTNPLGEEEEIDRYLLRSVVIGGFLFVAIIDCEPNVMRYSKKNTHATALLNSCKSINNTGGISCKGAVNFMMIDEDGNAMGMTKEDFSKIVDAHKTQCKSRK